MRSFRLFCLAAATMCLSDAGYLDWSAAKAQQQQVSAVLELDGARLAVSAEERRVLLNLNGARTRQQSYLDRALEEARRVANSRDARYALALYELDIGSRRGDVTMREQALDVLISSQLTGHDKLPGFLAVRGQIAYQAGDFDMAGRLWDRLAELAPSDPDVFANLAQVRLAQQNASGAMELLTHAIAIREAGVQRAPENWYRQRLIIAQQGNLTAPGFDAARALISEYPTSENWRTALLVYRNLASVEGAFEIDLFRLMRYIGALARTDEYQRMAQLLRQYGEPREAKAVLDEGVMRGLLDAGTSPTREIIAEVDRAVADAQSEAVTRPEPTRAGALVRLGMSRLAAGQPIEAEAAFRSAAADQAGANYVDLAFFWLEWLAWKQSAPEQAS